MTGGAGNDVFTVLPYLQTDFVTDFSDGDKIRVDVNGHSATRLTKVSTYGKIRWTNTENHGGDKNINDTAIYYTQGTKHHFGDDQLVMVLEDYTEDLTMAHFDVV